MNRALLVRSILTRMRRYKLRTLCMGLGITVSVLATVLLQTASVTVKDAFTRFIRRMYPADSVHIMAGTGFMGSRAERSKLKLAEVETVVNTLGITEWDPGVMAGGRDVGEGGANIRVGVIGRSHMAERVHSRSVSDGEFFTADDVRHRANVALIGTTTARTLFPGESPVGKTLFIDNVAFEIKGLLEPAGVDPHGGDMDNTIWVPYTTLMDTMLRVENISGATLIVGDPARAEAAKNEIATILRQQHQIGPGQEDDFTVITPTFMYSLVERTFRTFGLFVPIIAGTAFLISAAVILSIMQISIKARVAEIGLRKALGARPRDLRTQIVLEVVVITVIASVAGILLAQLGGAWLGPVLAKKFGATKGMTPPPLVLAIAVLAALVTGIVGALLPANRAAKLDPVTALRTK